MPLMDSYKPKVNGEVYVLTAPQMEHLCLMFLERMAKSVDLEHITRTMVRDMCFVMLEKYGKRALSTPLQPKSIVNRQQYLQYLNRVIPYGPMWEPPVVADQGVAEHG